MSVSGWKLLRRRFELLGVKLLMRLARIAPYRSSVQAGGLLGVIAFDLLRIRRRVTLDNLERALGDDYSAAQRVRIARRSYVNFAKSMIEFGSLGRLDRKRLAELVRITGGENIERALAGGRGAIIVTGHYGSWELLGAAAVAHGIPADFLVGEQSNSLVDDLINDLRRSAGIGIIPRGVAARGVFAALRRGRVVALLSDQDARRAGIFVDFFATPASTYPGAAQFAYRTGCPMVFCYIVRGPGERHEAIFLPPLEVDPRAGRDQEVLRLTQEHTRALEAAVRRHPDHYFWAHRRWKTRPAAPDAGA